MNHEPTKTNDTSRISKGVKYREKQNIEDKQKIETDTVVFHARGQHSTNPMVDGRERIKNKARIRN